MDGTRDLSHFVQAYEGTPPWDIGRPQPAFVRLFDAGAIVGAVLDAGCGTGEHALLATARGHAAVGVDVVPAAIERARAKAGDRDRGLAPDFVVADALRLEALGRTFDTVLDCGLFHVFSDADRARYVASLARALRDGGRAFVLCFSEREPGDWGPRRVTERELRDAFRDGWEVERVVPERLETNLGPQGVHAWLAVVRRAAQRSRVASPGYEGPEGVSRVQANVADPSNARLEDWNDNWQWSPVVEAWASSR